ncbi:branched-chain amino acid ABC transporter permease [Pusillimonas caeni]|uniref:branched-chain amino acid ABC transporter permease n=1 Tax=Pusillimonas caeni TaxID=1348472 RepID=UPI000E59E6FA|nr:branched-chain amino acid ABC transporter permease [Pusillimonas caeni]TFL13119.1 branched-chain amino acid ABC transporter permease [Pusillimonas caeni]
MIYVQYFVNGLLLGGLYACIAAGFSLVWGVMNIINMMHGAFIVLGAYIAYFSYVLFGVHPFFSVLSAGLLIGAAGYLIQRGIINRVVGKPVLVTFTLTFGLEMILNNAMLLGFTADYRKVSLAEPMGTLDWSGLFLPLDRVGAMALAIAVIMAVYLALRRSRIGRAIVAVRFDREAAQLMGVDVAKTYAVTFALGAMMAAAAGALVSVVFPISPVTGHLFLGKAFVICVLGGVGSIAGAVAGGLALGLLESFGGMLFGPEYALTLSFCVLLVLLTFRPRGLMGIRGYE